MKLIVWLCITVGGTFGGWVGAALDHSNWFGAWSILLGAVGSFVGLWVGFKIGKTYFE